MSQPIVIPPVKTPEQLFADAMNNPQIRARAMRDPLFAARLRESLARPNMISQTSGQIDAGNPRNFVQPSPTAVFHGLGAVSVADQVRMQRDAFLVADGAQVAGNYDTAMRRRVGGIAAPRTPKVGSPSASYPYPGNNMRTGAALAASPTGGGVMATEARGLLPTTGYNPDFFIATRPDSLNRTLGTNRPVPMSRADGWKRATDGWKRATDKTARATDKATRATDIITSSPSEARRRNITTLLGLGAAQDIDSWKVVRNFFADPNQPYAKKAIGKKVQPAFNKWFAFLDERELTEAEQQALDNSSAGNQALQILKNVGLAASRQGLMAMLLTDKIDFNDPVVKAMFGPLLKDLDLNKYLNDWISGFVGPDWAALTSAVGAKFPLKISTLGWRRDLIRYLYWSVWGKYPSDSVYAAISSKLACSTTAFGSSVQMAVSVMSGAEYAPGQTPKADTCPAAEQYALPPPPPETAGEAVEEPVNPAIVKGAIYTGVALLAVGLYFKLR